ncbi:MAG: DinB family protein [Planctomycetes bacterium]|nr:DinB family protein [Planctomycetota bacterium]MCW8136120.1 DinB family protein [Planctomycetota bacterium]
MKLAEILKQDAEGVYRAAEGLFKQVDDQTLDWKPQTGSNWMTVGQLLHHASNACGSTIKGFITGDWGFPTDAKPQDTPPDAMMPPAEKMPAVKSKVEALKLLAEDKALCMKLLSEVSEDRLANERSAPPWGGPERTLYQHCNEMIWHLGQHKGQLFYYLKLQGKPVNTMTLWAGM